MKETPKAAQAWADYLALGPDRSLEKLASRYHRRRKFPKSSPASTLRQLKRWSAEFGWQDRLRDIVDREVREAQEREAAHVREVMETGYALPHHRVALLKRLTDDLVADVTEGGRRWVRDVKVIGTGEEAEKVDVERFNESEFKQIRGLLDDIAKEKGERGLRVKIDIEQRIRVMAEKLGLDPDAAIEEAQRILREGVGAAAR